MVVLEIKNNRDQKEVNLYHNKKNRKNQFYRTFINSDYHSLLQLLFDLEREGFPILQACRRYLEIKVNKDKSDDWLF